MGQSDFQERLERIDLQKDSTGKRLARGGTTLMPLVSGALCSAAVLWLFFNIQGIDGFIPESFRRSDIPGLWQTVVGIVSLVWFAVIPAWFALNLLGGLLLRRMPAGLPFLTGASAALAAGYFLLPVSEG